MQAAFVEAGQPNILNAGDVWVVRDFHIDFADANPTSRTEHETRPVIVFQDDGAGDNDLCGSVVIVPMSSKGDAKLSYEDWLEPFESGLAYPSVVKLQLIQPVPRRAFESGTFIGSLDKPVLARLRRHLLENLSIL